MGYAGLPLRAGALAGCIIKHWGCGLKWINKYSDGHEAVPEVGLRQIESKFG